MTAVAILQVFCTPAGSTVLRHLRWFLTHDRAPLDRFADISVLISYRTSAYVRAVASCCVRLAARELRVGVVPSERDDELAGCRPFRPAGRWCARSAARGSCVGMKWINGTGTPLAPKCRGADVALLGLRLQVRRHRLHLRQAQILGDAMHDGDITHVALEGGQLLQDILRVLTCESREVLQAVRVGPVTGTASGHAFRLDAVPVDFTPTCHQRRVPPC